MVFIKYLNYSNLGRFSMGFRLLNVRFVRLLAIIMPFLFASNMALAQPRVSVPVKIKIEDGGMEEVTVVLKNVTTGETNEIPGSQRVDLELKLNNNYIISFTKSGYITKRVSFDASMPSMRSTQELYPFNFEVVLFPQYEGVNIVVFNQPVAKIFFDPLLDDFDYDTDYTKQIQSALKKAEEEIAQRQKEERKKAAEVKKQEQQQLAEQNRIRIEQERIRAEEEKKLKNEEEKRKREEARQQRVAEDQRRAESRAMQGENQRRQASQSGNDVRPSAGNGANGVDERRAASGNTGLDGGGSRASGTAGESNRTNVQASSGNDVKEQGSNSLSGSDTKADGRNVVIQGTDESGSKKATVSTGADRRSIPTDTKGAAKPKQESLVAQPTMPPTTFNSGMNVDEYHENGKKIIKVTYVDPAMKPVFMKVIYDWGGVYYFRSGRYISQAYFQSVTGIK